MTNWRCVLFKGLVISYEWQVTRQTAFKYFHKYPPNIFLETLIQNIFEIGIGFYYFTLLGSHGNFTCVKSILMVSVSDPLTGDITGINKNGMN